MKSGTTSLWQYLNAHPDIYMCYPKEPGFFVEELNWSKGWDWYEALFSEADSAGAIGEASTHYTKFPIHQDVPNKIAKYLPDAKFIYVMREPIARAVSHYWHMFHYWHETRPMLKAVRNDPQYVAYSSYALQLEQYLPFFSLDRFYLTTFERLKAQPRDVVKECYDFIGVDPEFVPVELGEVHNKGPQHLRRTRGFVHRVRWSPWWTTIAPLVPQRFKELGKRLEFTRMERPHETPKEVIEHLRPIFDVENERLFQLIGKRFNEWTRERVPSALVSGAAK